MTVTVSPAIALAGTVVLPADKSVAHRAAILAALAPGRSEIVGFSEAEDPQSTLACLRALGIETETGEDGRLIVWNPQERFDVEDVLDGAAKIELAELGEERWHEVVLRKS